MISLCWWRRFVRFRVGGWVEVIVVAGSVATSDRPKRGGVECVYDWSLQARWFDVSCEAIAALLCGTKLSLVGCT